jgi:hypothetical protein
MLDGSARYLWYAEPHKYADCLIDQLLHSSSTYASASIFSAFFLASSIEPTM